jgi:type I restriction enzyme S subunit
MRNGWTETSLGEVVLLNPEATKNFDADKEIVYIDLSSVSAEHGIARDLAISSYKDAPGRARRVIRVHDVLVSTVRPYLKGFAQVPGYLDGQVASTGFAVLRAIPGKSISGYIWAVVGTELFVAHLMQRATGSSYPAVRPEDISSFGIELPPLAEQMRIVDVLSSVDDYIVALQQQADSARLARNVVLQEMLSAGGDDWTVTTLSEISKFVSKRESPKALARDTPYVGLEHVEPKTTLISAWGDVQSVSSSVTPFEPEDTLFGRLRPYLHKVAFADFPGVCSPEILVLRSNAQCESKFLYILCSLDSTIKNCVDMSAGTRMPRTSTRDLASIEIQLPPISEQERIVEIVSSMDDVIKSTERAVIDAKNLRSGLLSDLLSGDHEIPASYDSLLGAA